MSIVDDRSRELAVISDAESTASWINASGLAEAEVAPRVREIAAQLQTWVSETRAATGRSSLFNRRSYVVPDNPFVQMRTARAAVSDDDIVSGAAEVTEALALQGISWEGPSVDDADVFNQMATELDLDAFARAMYRELYTCSQVVVASWWARKEYTVRGFTAPPLPKLDKATDPVTGETTFSEPLDPETNRPLKPKRRGQRRRTKYSVVVPTRLTILDSSRIVPVGQTLWGTERLAWQATSEELDVWTSLQDLTDDLTMTTLVKGRYTPGTLEEAELADLGVDTKNLLELNPERVWRLTMTRSNYQRWPDIRLKSVFRLLDLKAQLMEADRVNLVGAANYLLLVKKGSKEEPAYAEELANLKENFGVVAKLPVIVSDHRLEIEIITPKTDLTLVNEKYATLDARILARCLGSLVTSQVTASTASSASDATVTSRMIGRVLENRRHAIRRFLEAQVAERVMALNPGKFEEAPNLAFTPRGVQIDSDAQITQAIMALRTQKELSRETTLEFFGFDQEVEMQRRISEEESGADAVFGTSVPFDSPANAQNAGGLPPGAFGPTGGRPTGGGQPSQNTTKPGSAAR